MRRALTFSLVIGASVVFIALNAIVGHRRPSAECSRRPLAPTVAGRATAPIRLLRSLIETVPCVGSGRVSYGAKDDHSEELAGLDPIEDPAGGYLGVYASPVGSPAGATEADFRISVAHSDDLIDWKRTRILEGAGASMPTLRRVPGQSSYLLACEQSEHHGVNAFIQIRYFRSLNGLLANRVAAQVDLPRRLSRFNNERLRFSRSIGAALFAGRSSPWASITRRRFMDDQVPIARDSERSAASGNGRHVPTTRSMLAWTSGASKEATAIASNSVSTTSCGACTRPRRCFLDLPPGTCCSTTPHRGRCAP